MCEVQVQKGVGPGFCSDTARESCEAVGFVGMLGLGLLKSVGMSGSSLLKVHRVMNLSILTKFQNFILQDRRFFFFLMSVYTRGGQGCDRMTPRASWEPWIVTASSLILEADMIGVSQ